jgi:hypothetical protein
MQFTIMVTNPDGSSACLYEIHEHQNRVENWFLDAENPQHAEISNSSHDENDEIVASKDESEEKKGEKRKDQDVDILRYPLPPTEIHDGLLFQKVG